MTRFLRHRVLRNLRRYAGRGFALFLLVFETLFLSVIVPGHTRGILTMSGPSRPVSLADLGCPFCRMADDVASPDNADSTGKPFCPHCASNQRHAPSRKDQSDCAICHLSVRLIAMRVELWTPTLQLTIERSESAPHVAPILPALPLHDSRGPPAMFS